MWVWFKRFSFLGVFCFFSLGFSSSVFASDETTDPVTVYDFRGAIYFDLESAKEAVKNYVLEQNNVYPELENVYSRYEHILKFQPYIDAEEAAPFEVFSPGPQSGNGFTNSLQESIAYWEASNNAGSANCPDSYFENIQSQPLVFQYYIPFTQPNNYFGGEGRARYYRANYSATVVYYVRKMVNGVSTCVEERDTTTHVFQKYEAFQCDATQGSWLLPHPTNETDIPRCNPWSVLDVYKKPGCPSSHPVPVKNNSGEIEVCVKQKQCPFNQPSHDKVGNPISCSSGEKIQMESIYQGSGADPLNFSTYYSSQQYDEASDSLIGDFSSGQGKQRNDNHSRKIESIYNANGVVVYKMTYRNGFSHLYYGSSSATTLQSNYPKSGSLTINSGTFSQTSPNGTVYQFNASGQLTSRVLSNGQTRNYTYDSNGKLSSVTNHFGKSLQYFYNANDLLERLTTPDNQEYFFDYDSNDNLIKITYPDETPANLSDNPSLQFLFEDSRFPNHLTGKINEKGVRYASWSYDDKGRAISSEHGTAIEKVELDYSIANQTRVTTHVSHSLSSDKIYHYRTRYVEGSPEKQLTQLEQLTCNDCEVGNWLYEYNTQGLIRKSTSPTGRVTTYQYNSDRLETQRIEAVGTADEKTIVTTWQSGTRRIASMTQANVKTDYVYNGNGQITTRTETDLTTSETRTTHYTYNSDGLVTSINGPRTDVNDVTTLAYDNLGNLISSSNALGQVTTFENYDANGRVGKITDANGIESLFTYTPRGWLKTSTINGATTTYEYFPTGALKSVTNPFGQVINYEYDDGERLIAVEDNQGNRMEYTRDLMGNVTQTHIKDSGDVLKQSQQAVFNALGQLKQSLGNNGQSMELTYDAEGNPTSDNNALNHTTTSSFDALNRLTETLDANNGSTAYTYDSFDRVTSVTDAEGKVTSYTYNAFGDLTELTSPDTGTSTFTYDKAGNLLTKTDPRGITVTYTYDALNRLLTESYPNTAENKVYSYDDTTNGNKGIGRLTRVTDQSGVTIYRYNAFGQVTQQTQRIGSNRYILRYHYNAKGRMTGMTYPSGKRVLFSYNALGQVSRVRLRQGSQVSNLARNIRYLPFGPIKSLVYGNGKILRQSYDLDYRLTRKSVTGIHGLNYQYDLTDNVTQIQNGTDAENYVYDALSRLTQGQGSYGTLDYSYDKIGNRLSKTDNGNTDNYLYGSTGHWLTSITGSNPFNFTHDAAGNTLSQGNLLFSYNQQGRLRRAVRSDMSAHYRYNYQGERVQKKVNGTITQYIYNLNGQLIAEADSNGTIIKEYSYIQGQPFAQIQNNQVYYYHNDHLGTPKVITDQNQQIVWQATHTPFGQATITTSAIENNLRFAGQYHDAETNLHYNYFRYYSPAMGRYITSDPIGLNGGINTYGYVGGNPVNYIDPLGLIEWKGTIEGASGTVFVGAGFYLIKLSSECVDGKRAKVLINAIGPAVGVGGKLSVGGSHITVNDKHDSINPMTFNGWFTYWVAGISVGISYSAYSIQIGGNGSIGSPTGARGSGAGFGGGWGYGITGNPGSSAVVDIEYETCSQGCSD